MQITVFGATGTFGARIVEQLRQRGHAVIAAHRGSGVDTYTGHGVAEARAQQAGTTPSKIIGLPLPGPTSRDGLIPPSPRLSDVALDDWLRTL